MTAFLLMIVMGLGSGSPIIYGGPWGPGPIIHSVPHVGGLV